MDDPDRASSSSSSSVSRSRGQMRRKLLNLAAVLSVIVAVGLSILFVAGRSRTTFGRQHLVGNWHYDFIDSHAVGCVGVRLYHDWPTPSVSPPLAPNGTYTPAALAWYNALPAGRHVRWLGFDCDHQIYIERDAALRLVAHGWGLSLSVPLWAMWLAWVTALLLVVVIGRRMASDRRRTRGQCVRCGYDLRATPGRCPECGTVADHVVQQAT